jgi:hypothetical protein
MRPLAAAACVGLLLLLGAKAPAQTQTGTPRVRLLVPTLPEQTELAVLTRAELVAGGLVVEHRAVPAGPLDAWLHEAQRDGALAVVALDPAPAQVRLWLLAGPASLPGPPLTLVEPMAAAFPGPGAVEAATSRARTTLALRIAERIHEHRADQTVRTRPAQAAAIAKAPLPEVGSPSPSPPPQVEVLLFAGRSLHPGALAIGLEFALTRPLGRWWQGRIGFSERGPHAALAAPGGTARPYESGLLASLVLGRAQGRLTPELSLGGGVQHTLVVGQGAPGFQGHTEGSFSAVLAARAGARLQLGRGLSLLAAARAFQLLPAPAVIIDDVEVSRTGPGYEAGLGVSLAY